MRMPEERALCTEVGLWPGRKEVLRRCQLLQVPLTSDTAGGVYYGHKRRQRELKWI